MPGKQPVRPLLDARQAAFLGGPVSIGLASHDAERLPSLCRAYGCRVSDDRQQVIVYVSVRRSARVLRDIAAGEPVAAVFSRPKTHETLQLKASTAKVRPLVPEDHAALAASGAAFGGEIMALGYSEAFTRTMLAALREESAAVVLVPEAAFEQTPGPAAGRRLDPPA